MSRAEENFQNWSESKFQGLNKDDLIAAGVVLGLTLPKQMGEDKMREKLCEKLGVTPSKVVAHLPQAPVRTTGIFDPKPNLTPGNRWGGRWHQVMVFPPSQESGLPENFFQITWENVPKAYHFNTVLRMPEPYYQILVNAVTTKLTQKGIRDEEGILVKVENVESSQPTYNVQYHGVVPGTEDLPASLQEYWQRQALKHDNFSQIPRRELTRIRSDLFTPLPPAKLRDLTDQDILYDILTFLFGDEAMAA